MKDFSLSRFQAVEVQAILRNHGNPPNDSQFEAVVQAVRDGHSISNLNQEKIRKSRFTLVLDIDGTLLDQDSGSKWLPGFHKRSFLVNGRKVNHVALNPGALSFAERAKELGGAVVLFSRNNDLLIGEILRSFDLEGEPLANYFDGILTSSHMVVPKELSHTVGSNRLSRILKKDLRIIDSDRIFLVDDNPSYVLQQGQLRVVNEFSLKSALTTPNFGFDYNKYYYWSGYEGLLGMRPGRGEKLTKQEREKLDLYISNTKKEYGKIADELEFLADDLATFSSKQQVFSPIGQEALNLLTDRVPGYTLGLRKPMKFQDALSFLLNDPTQIKATISKKRKKVKPKPRALFFSFGDDRLKDGDE